MKNKVSCLHLIALTVITFSFTIFWACDEDNGEEPVLSSKVVGTEGAIVTSGDGQVTVDLPEGALGEATSVSVEVNETYEMQGAVGPVYTMDAENVETFEKPVTLTFRYTDDMLNGISPESLIVGFRREQNRYWEPITDVEINTAAKTVSVTTDHFSEWSLLEGTGYMDITMREGDFSTRIEAGPGSHYLTRTDVRDTTGVVYVDGRYTVKLVETAYHPSDTLFQPVSRQLIIYDGDDMLFATSSEGVQTTYSSLASEPGAIQSGIFNGNVIRMSDGREIECKGIFYFLVRE